MLASVWVCRAAPWSGLLPRLLQARGLRLVALPLGCFNPLLGGGWGAVLEMGFDDPALITRLRRVNRVVAGSVPGSCLRYRPTVRLDYIINRVV